MHGGALSCRRSAELLSLSYFGRRAQSINILRKKVLGLSSALIASIKADLSASHKVHCINRQTGVFSI